MSFLSFSYTTILIILFNCGGSFAQTKAPSEEMISALSEEKSALTRSLSGQSLENAPLSDEDLSILKSVQSRGLKFETTEKVGEIIDRNRLPSLDINIAFDFDSDTINKESLPILDALGNALLDDRLANSKILLNGHTDTKGDEAYNLSLSQRRATVIRHYLLSNFSIEESRLVALGFGEMRLKDPDNPEGEINRRVEVVNSGTFR